MRIYKISGVDDFMSGVSGYDLDQMPPEDQLSDKQRDKIRDETLYHGNPSKNIPYFLKYPNVAYLSLWDIAKAAEWGMDEGVLYKATDLWLKTKDIDHDVPWNLPEWGYNLIIQNFDKSRFSISAAGDVFSSSGRYPENFVEFISNEFPDISSSLNDLSLSKRSQILKDYLEFPSKENLVILENAQTKAEIDTSDPNQSRFVDPEGRTLSFEMMNYLFTSDDVRKKAKNVRNLYRDHDWVLNAMEMSEYLHELQDAYLQNKEFYKEDNPFALIVDDTPFGTTRTLLLQDRVIPIDVVNSILDIVDNASSDNYWSLYWGRAQNLEYKIDTIPEDLGDSIYIYNENGDLHDVANGGSQMAFLNSGAYSNDDFYLDNLRKAVKVTVQEESNLFDNWWKKRLDEGNLSDQEYLSIVQSSEVGRMTEKAGQDLFGLKIQNNTLMDADAYTPYAQTHWTMLWPFNIQSAMDLWEKIPVNVRSAAATDYAGTWFLCLSGLFPCDKVFERLSKYVTDAKKVIDHIQCLGDSEGLKQSLRDAISIKEQKIESQMREKMPDFLESDAVKKYNLSDFPEVYNYAMETLKSNVSDEQVYDYKSTNNRDKREMLSEELGETNVLFVDAEKYLSVFGEDGAKYFSASPREANGFFVNGYSMFGSGPTVVIYTNQLSSMPTTEQVLNGLGIDATTSDLSLSEENTLWHEVSHALLDKVVGRGGGGGGSEIENESQWLTSPQEISAMTYGNLQHIKKRIREYFESIYPFPDRITQGLISQIKSDIIETFAWEFQGMEKQQALLMVEDSMPEFNEEVLDTLNKLSKEEQINMMTNMFTEFFMRKMMRSKVEDQLKSQLQDVGKDINKINFNDETVVADPYDYMSSTYQPDDIISQLSTREDYKQFLKSCQEVIANAYKSYGSERFEEMFRPYIANRTQPYLHPVVDFEDLLLLMFGQPATIGSVDIESKNTLFGDLIPNSLLFDVKEIVERERVLSENRFNVGKETPVSPQEAEDAGKFMTEMDEQHGTDWMWLAKNKSKLITSQNEFNWYRTALENHRLKSFRVGW